MTLFSTCYRNQTGSNLQYRPQATLSFLPDLTHTSPYAMLHLWLWTLKQVVYLAVQPLSPTLTVGSLPSTTHRLAFNPHRDCG